MILQSKDCFDEIAEFNPVTGHVKVFSKKASAGLGQCRPKGSYSELDGHRLILFVEDGVLFFRADEFVCQINNDVKATFIRKHTTNEFVMLKGNSQLFRMAYAPPKINPPLKNDPTPFVDEEDYDFALFAYNVINNRSRNELFITANG